MRTVPARYRTSGVLLALILSLATFTACEEQTIPISPEAADLGASAGQLQAAAEGNFEVWVVDQSNSPGQSYGGTLYVYPGADLMGAAASKAQPLARIDLAGETAALCQSTTGAAPVRPHMILFNESFSHAVLSFVVSGHVVVFEAATRAPVACVRTSPGAGGARQAHAAIPSRDGSYILVANQNGKLLERIDANYAANSFVLNPAATLNLATCTTPNGLPCQDAALRPDNAPICPVLDASSTLGFVTLRGGGLFAVDPKATPMRILAEYDRAVVSGNGCGGAQAGGSMFLNSGGGTASNLHQFDLYRFPLSGYSPANPPNTPAPAVLLSDNTPGRDAHGVVLTKQDRYLWVLDRGTNVAEVLDAAKGTHVNTVHLAGSVSPDPTPDLGALSPGGNRMFVTLRGPNPLSGDPHVATGSTPGIGVVRMEAGGRTGTLMAVVPISNVDAGGVERADPHGIAVRLR